MNWIRALVIVAFLPHQAWISMDAMVRSLYRARISKRNLLEWETADSAGANAHRHVNATVRQMLVICALFRGPDDRSWPPRAPFFPPSPSSALWAAFAASDVVAARSRPVPSVIPISTPRISRCFCASAPASPGGILTTWSTRNATGCLPIIRSWLCTSKWPSAPRPPTSECGSPRRSPRAISAISRADDLLAGAPLKPWPRSIAWSVTKAIF